MTTLQSNIDKALIGQLPVEGFGGRIIVVQSKSEAEKAVNYLLRQPLVGLDTETRPAFRKGATYSVALLQVSTADTCFLFRLNMIGFPEALKNFFEAPEVLKIGLSLKDDFDRLHRMGEFKQTNWLELQQYASEMGIEAQSLQKIYAILFGRKISKSQRLTNWEADVLTDAQKVYAATDAWACVRMYERMHDLRESGEYEVITPEADDENEE